jgi:cytochrome b involved in lipid metabolism
MPSIGDYVPDEHEREMAEAMREVAIKKQRDKNWKPMKYAMIAVVTVVAATYTITRFFDLSIRASF